MKMNRFLMRLMTTGCDINDNIALIGLSQDIKANVYNQIKRKNIKADGLQLNIVVTHGNVVARMVTDDAPGGRELNIETGFLPSHQDAITAIANNITTAVKLCAKGGK